MSGWREHLLYLGGAKGGALGGAIVSLYQNGGCDESLSLRILFRLYSSKITKKIGKLHIWEPRSLEEQILEVIFFSLRLGKSQSTSAQEKYPKTNRGQEISTKGGDYMSIEEMKNVDVRTVDRDRLVDINEIEIDDSLPPKERVAEFLRQIKNPYCFRVGKVVVKNVYSDDGVSLQERFEQFARTL